VNINNKIIVEFLYFSAHGTHQKHHLLAEPLETAVTLLDDSELEALAGGEGDEGLGGLANDEDV